MGGPMMQLKWLLLLPQIVVVCAVDDVLDRLYPSRKPGTLRIDIDRCRAWVER